MYHLRSTKGDGVKQAGKATLKLGIEVKVIDEVSHLSKIIIITILQQPGWVAQVVNVSYHVFQHSSSYFQELIKY